MKFTFGFIVLAVSAAFAAEETHPKFTIVTPQDYQVYQRETRTKGVVKFEAQHLHVSMDSMQYRFIGKSLEGEIGTAWNDLNADIDGEHFSGKLPVTAGGWYKLEVRLLKVGKSVFETSVEHVGVGEVFVIAGQSNSTNYGSEKQKTASLMVSSFDGKKWVLADDPNPARRMAARAAVSRPRSAMRSLKNTRFPSVSPRPAQAQPACGSGSQKASA